MGNNILVVESKNDKFFLNAIIDYLNFDIDITEPILIEESDYLSMDGLDLDDQSEENRVAFVNNCLQAVFPVCQPLLKVNEFINLNFEDFDVQLACHFINVNGTGELETVLRSVKSKVSVFADCLDSWKDCLQGQGKTISLKEFNKFWVSLYLRFDTCDDNEKRQAERKCSMKGFEYVMKEKQDIWDFENPVLDELKQFLKLFC